MAKHTHSGPKFKCPLCSSQLTKERWPDVTGVWKEKAKLIAEGKQREKDAEERGKKHERRRITYLESLLEQRDNKYDKIHVELLELRAHRAGAGAEPADRERLGRSWSAGARASS